MNLPSFTGSNKAFFFVSEYKITQSRQGDSLDGDGGLDDVFFHLHTPNTMYGLVASSHAPF